MKNILENLVANPNNVFVIAEIGHNHQGKVEICKSMFLAAKEAGAHAVKLQKRNNKTLYTKSLYNEPYNSENSYASIYGEHREALEFNKEQYLELIDYAKQINIYFFATAFDFESLDFLINLGMPAFKIASGDLLNTPLQRRIAKLGKPVFLSTGGGTFNDIKRAVETIIEHNRELIVFHCTASYPADVEDMNLNVIPELKRLFPDIIIGLSDHENGIDAASVGYMLGARVFEKHFTLNRAWKGTDQSFSLEPEGLRKLIRNLNRIPILLGSSDKQLLESEKRPLKKMAKSLVAKTNLKAGHALSEVDIAIKSPGGGLPPYELENIIGKVLKVDINEDENLLFENFI
ncbi:N-acetylneuraminate synthase family protein [Pedobacter sp. P351]|uniref:N-acetylneuraminate synthase family protein n=1 Tax=Pedobacter superstes TaxID=3133441 RepID=UPI0030AC3217